MPVRRLCALLLVVVARRVSRCPPCCAPCRRAALPLPDLGVLAFTFWVEVFVGIVLTPWAVLNGEAEQLIFGDAASSATDWFLLWFTGAYGGVRIFSQFALLKHTSATTLALSNVTIQALTTILGIFLFATPVTNFLVAGVAVTLLATAGYTYCKTTKVLESGKAKEII